MSAYDDAKAALAAFDSGDQYGPHPLAEALRALLGTREDSAPETIALSVIADRYGDLDTFLYALNTDPQGLGFTAVLNMLKEAAARGMDAREEEW